MRLLFFIVWLTGCAGVPIEDSEWFGSLGSQGASAFHTFTPTTASLTLQQWAEAWDDLANPLGPMVCTRSETLAKLKGAVEKLCSDHDGMCSYDMKEQVGALSSRLDTVTEKAKKAARK